MNKICYINLDITNENNIKLSHTNHNAQELPCLSEKYK